MSKKVWDAINPATMSKPMARRWRQLDFLRDLTLLDRMQAAQRREYGLDSKSLYPTAPQPNSRNSEKET